VKKIPNASGLRAMTWLSSRREYVMSHHHHVGGRPKIAPTRGRPAESDDEAGHCSYDKSPRHVREVPKEASKRYLIPTLIAAGTRAPATKT
jgi:hypothetical protein